MDAIFQINFNLLRFHIWILSAKFPHVINKKLTLTFRRVPVSLSPVITGMVPSCRTACDGVILHFIFSPRVAVPSWIITRICANTSFYDPCFFKFILTCWSHTCGFDSGWRFLQTNFFRNGMLSY